MKLTAVQGDITKLEVDAIVNAANCTLLGGGGVDGAIHRAAGRELLEACRVFGGCKTGEARITPGFRLPAKFVIHTPGPVWHGGKRGEPELLRACYVNSLTLAVENGCKSIAFPAISTGVYGYPKREAAEIAVDVVRNWPQLHPKEVIFCCFSSEDLEIYQKKLNELKKQLIDELCSFIPYFEQQVNKKISWSSNMSDGNSVFPYPLYDLEVRQFVKKIHEFGCDQQYLENIKDFNIDSQNFENADMDLVRTLLTFFARGERFCDGLQAQRIENGWILQLLKRLRKISTNC